MKTVIFDIETDGLLEDLTKIHCIVWAELDTGLISWVPEQGRIMATALTVLEEADELIGHNIIGFDIPAIKKLYPEFNPKGRILDTLTWSRLAYPDLDGYSLKAWGGRMGELKGESPEDWTEYTEEMRDYCKQDVYVTMALHHKLYRKRVPDNVLDLEMKVAQILQTQKENGFLFDKEEAEKLYAELIGQHQELDSELQGLFPPWETVAKVFTPKRDNKTLGYLKGVEVTKMATIQFNPNSRPHIERCLKEKYDWKPKKFTVTGRAKLDETTLGDLKYPEAKSLARGMMLTKRLGQIGDGNNAWLKSIGPDGRIHGSMNGCGAVTGRMTHFGPNMGQVPNMYSDYGPECRALFTVAPGNKLVGIDASGIELRCLAHFMARYDGGTYAKAVIDGDIHSHNQEIAGLETRDQAKTMIYAFIYGAGNKKLGKIVGGTSKDGAKLRKTFLSRLPALGKLLADVNRVVESRGCLKGIDGRILKVRSQHSAPNTLLQSAAAVIMKQGLINFNNMLYGLEVPAKFVANVHDEWQVEAATVMAEDVGQAGVNSIRQAGKDFNFRCELDGEYKVGDNWSETH